jgi:predicted metalloendopeptidase
MLMAFLGQALGQLYVKRYFNEDAKKRVLALVNNLQNLSKTGSTTLIG